MKSHWIKRLKNLFKKKVPYQNTWFKVEHKWVGSSLGDWASSCIVQYPSFSDWTAFKIFHLYSQPNIRQCFRLNKGFLK